MQAPLTDKVQTVLISWFTTTEISSYTIPVQVFGGGGDLRT